MNDTRLRTQRLLDWWVQLLFVFIVALFIDISIFNVAISPVLAATSSDVNQRLSIDESRDVARATTVFIDHNLTRIDDFNQGNLSHDAGSGVIVHKNVVAGSDKNLREGEKAVYNYTILTAAHVVKETEAVYGIRFSNGDLIVINDDISDDINTSGTAEKNPKPIKIGDSGLPKSPSIYIQTFGYQKENGEFEGLDLATITFTSSHDYPVAALGKAHELSSNVLISGWPGETSSERKLLMTLSGVSGFKEETSNRKDGGYILKYRAVTEKGGSGGPVFNDRGEVIAIHGRGYDVKVDFRDSLGIPISLLFESNQALKSSLSLSSLTLPTPLDRSVFSFMKEEKDRLLAENITKEEYTKNFGVLDVVGADPAYHAIKSLQERYGDKCMAPYSDGTFRTGIPESRFNAVIDIGSCAELILDKISKLAPLSKSELVSLEKVVAGLEQDIEKLSSTKTPPPMRQQAVNASEAIPSSSIAFNFRSPGPYSYCLEDIIQLHLNVDGFKQRGRRGDCLSGIFTTYGDRGLTRSQALQLIEAANTYATTAFTGVKMYPPKGQRVRIAELFGFTYEVDTKR